MTIVHGQVFDPHGRPEPQASIYYVSAPVPMPDIAQLTDEEGKFSLSAPVPGSYTLGVHSERWGASQKTFEVSGEESLGIEVQLASSEDPIL